MMAIALLFAGCKGRDVMRGEVMQDGIASYDKNSDCPQGLEDDTYRGGKVSVSEDGVLSIESGVYADCGTSPEYWTIFRFIGRKGRTCRIVMDGSPFMQNVHAIHKDDGSTYYTVVCSGKESSFGGYNWLQAYRIVRNRIVRVSVTDGGKDYGQDRFSVTYSIPDWYFATWGAGYDWMFDYDAEKQNLYVPLSDGDYYSILTDRYRLWHFDGEKFVDRGERPHRDLHQSLAEYDCLIKYFTTKDYIVRVDSLKSKTLRYASWKRPKTMADAPDIVLAGGTRRQLPHASYEYDEFSFVNGGYEYIANYNEITPGKDGSGADSRICLLVRYGDRIIFRQEKEEE